MRKRPSKEQQAVYRKRYHEKHKEEILRRAKEWRKQNLEKCLATQKRYREKHREKINARHRLRYTTDHRWEKQLKHRFNITTEEYWRMHAEQSGLCKICDRPQIVGTKLDVDHDHTTEKVRGLLCRHCNTGIGLLKDSVELIAKALTYLVEASKEKA